MHSTRVVAVLTLVVRLAHCFSWDIVVGGDKQLYFFYNGTITHTEEIPFVAPITSVTYDPVHYRVLFSRVNYLKMSIYSFDLSTRKIQSLFTKTSKEQNVRVVYDPVTQLMVWKEKNYIYTLTLNHASYQSDDGNLLLTLDRYCRDVAVESCGGYIYWITDYEIARARLDGSEREVIVGSVFLRLSIAIDQQTQRMYWIDIILKLNGNYQKSIESSNFNGENKTTLYIDKEAPLPSSLVVSKDFIYWQNCDEAGIWQLPKNSSDHVARKLYTIPTLSDWSYQRVAANYTIQEQMQGIKSCELVRDLILNNSKPESTAAICQNYCLEGDCSVNAEGQLTCSCKAGYTGKRCEVNACHQYCLHNGICSLNEEDEPMCECTADYEGERCDVAITHADDCADSSTQQVLRDPRSEMRQVFKEELKRILQLISDKLGGDEAKC